MALILASGSPRRAEILQNAGFDFHIRPAIFYGLSIVYHTLILFCISGQKFVESFSLCTKVTICNRTRRFARILNPFVIILRFNL